MTSLASPRAPANGSPGKSKFSVSRGMIRTCETTLLFGTGGIGKTSLASLSESPLFIDLAGETGHMDVRRVEGISTWSDLREFINGGDTAGAPTLVIDNVTAAEDLCRKHVIANVRTEKGHSVTSIEGYGWGKGGVYLVEEWRKLLCDLDAHRRAGKNLILIAHERVGKVPNPSGDDFIRYEPRLYTSPNASVMHVTKEWVDHVLFVSYDVVASDGKAKGSGTRTIYSAETATYMAKSRSLDGTPVVFGKGDGSIWTKLAMRAAAVVAAPEL